MADDATRSVHIQGHGDGEWAIRMRRRARVVEANGGRGRIMMALAVLGREDSGRLFSHTAGRASSAVATKPSRAD